MSRIQKLFGAIARRAPAQNRAGFPAWEPTLEGQYLQTLLTNTFGNTFYASAQELVAEAEEVHGRMLAADPAFAAQALAFAREEGFMRSQPLYGLARLAAVDGPLFAWAFPRVVKTPKDLADFATLVKALRGGSEGGRRIKRVAGAWLLANLTEYWAIKYGARDRGSGYGLRDLLRVYHPRAGEPNALVARVLGKDAGAAELPQLDGHTAAGRGAERAAGGRDRPRQRSVTGQPRSAERLDRYEAFATLKAARTAEEKVAAIRAGRLPHEVVTPFAGQDPVVWDALVRELPVFALLRHLAALERHGVAEAQRAYIVGKLTDPEVIRRSKILPFRFAVAARKVESAWLADALREALELSFENVPDIPGRTAVLLDRSGSMAGFMETAAIFAVATLKKARLDGRLLAFDHELEEVRVSLRDSVLTQAAAITARGGTDTALPLRRLLADRDVVDNIVLVTDEQQNAGAPFFEVLSAYRQKVNRAVRVFVIDVAPYRSAVTPPGAPGTWVVYGWSDQALRYVSLTAQGYAGLVETLRAQVTPVDR